MSNVERSHHNKEYQTRPSELGFLEQMCIFHPQGKHKTWHCDQLQGIIDDLLKMAKKADQEKKLEDPKRDFPKAHKEVNYIYGGPDAYESKRKQKFTAREVMVVLPTTLEYLKWFEIPITFNCSDHPDFIPKPGQYALIVNPIVKDVKLNRVLIDGGSSLKILFLKTFNQMGCQDQHCVPWVPFHGIVPAQQRPPLI
jgi:hypothetical protein